MSADRELRLLREKLEQLTGERGAPERAALRRGQAVPPTLEAQEVSSAPSAADYNRLVNDMRRIAAVIESLMA